MAFITFKHCQLFVLFFWITCAQSSNSSGQDTSKYQIDMELFDPGPFIWSPQTHNFHNFKGNFYLHLNGLDITSVFPNSTSGSTLILKLSRDRLLENDNLIDQTNVLIAKKNGDRFLLDKDNSPEDTISLFRGQIQFPHANFSTTNFHSEVLANGYINAKTQSVWLLAFIKIDDNYFYIRPYIGNSSSTTSYTSNVHLISRESVHFFNFFKSQFKNSFRKKRKTEHTVPEKAAEKRCPLSISVDFSLFERLGSKKHRTIHFVQTVFRFANNIFLDTVWTKSGHPFDDEDLFEGYGNALCSIVIYEQPALEAMNPLYNSERDYWDVEHLVGVLKRLPNRPNFCLSYLFTGLPIIETKNSDFQGYAMPGSLFSSQESRPNVGAVSFHSCPDPLDFFCLLNFAHELGHSYGAYHDPSSKECIPDKGGSYLMGTPFLFEKGPNNMIFSPCSVRNIYAKIASIDENVFNSYCSKCGNGHVDAGEECDEGDHHGECCSEKCTLLGHAQCSRFNHDCCTEHCKMANFGVLCRPADALYCSAESFCSGTSLDCPRARKWPDGTVCSEGGTCSGGYCNTTCPKGYSQCDCPTPTKTKGEEEEDIPSSYQCFMCCRKNGEGNACSHNVPYPTGYGCFFNETVYGACRGGYCEEITTEEEMPTKDDEGMKIVSFWTFLIGFSMVGFIVLTLVALYFTRKRVPGRFIERIEHLQQQQQLVEENVFVSLKEKEQGLPTANNGNGHSSLG